MKKIRQHIIFLLGVLIMTSCEDTIFPELPEAEDYVVVDAWINDLPERQTIRLTQSLPYYDAVTPPGITGATVTITDDLGEVYVFEEGNSPGDYVWEPTPAIPTFGAVGRNYTLDVNIGDRRIRSFSKMNRVPAIDSITFRLQEGNDFFTDSYFGGFFARDPQGPGDTYWIKTYKNGEYLNKPDEISIAYDAGFTAGSVIDGIVFIQPIRESINPFDTDENGDFVSPYAPGDSVRVEIHSITNEAFDFLTVVQEQIDRPGGFAELFATPLSNVPTNVFYVDQNISEDILGFFNVSAVSGSEGYLDPEDLPVAPSN